MESMTRHRHAYVQSVPCNFRLGDYSISVDKIDNFEPAEGDPCPSLVFEVNYNTRIVFPCLQTSHCLHDYRIYESQLLEILAFCFSCLGFPQPCVDRLMMEMVCFILIYVRSHRCLSNVQGNRVVSSVPYISIAHISLVLERLYEGAMPTVKRATNESIEALETVRLVELDGDQRKASCVVCLEDMDMDVQGKIVRMLCNHVFHRECIVEWLENSNMCPLCRFEMPFHELEV